MYDSVTIVTGEHAEGAAALRAVLETFRLRVNVHVGVWKQHLLDLIGGKAPCSEYVIFCAPGAAGQDTEDENLDSAQMGMSFPCVEQDEQTGQWSNPGFILTPALVRQIGKLPGKRVLFCGCGSGRQAFADAFLAAGCQSYIGAVGEVDGDAGAMFVLSYFYHLLAADRDLDRPPYSEREAFELACRFDRQSQWGTQRFRYFSKDAAAGVG